MTEYLLVIGLVTLVWLTGILASRAALGSQRSLSLSIGEGYFIGWALVLAGWTLSRWLTGGYSGLFVTLLMGLLLLGLAWLNRKQIRLANPKLGAPELCALAIALPLFILICIDVANRPLIAWDAWATYGFKAQLMLLLETPPEFVSPHTWQALAPDNGFAAYPGHGNGLSYVQLTIASAIGRWSEPLVSLAWPTALLAIGFLIHGYASQIRLGRWQACIAALLFTSMPAMIIHATLAGYGELFVIGYVLCAISFLHHSPQPWRHPQGALLLAIIVFAAVISKKTAVIFLLLLLFAWLVARPAWPRQRFVLPLLLTAMASIYTYCALGYPFELFLPLGPFGGIGIQQGVLHLPFPGANARLGEWLPVLHPILLQLFADTGLLLVPWLLAVATVVAASQFHHHDSSRRLCYWMLISGFAFYMVLAFTHQGEYVMQGTITMRFLMVHITISLMLALQWWANVQAPSPRESGTTTRP